METDYEMIAEELRRHPNALDFIRRRYGIQDASPEAAARHVFTYGGGNWWWACLGPPHTSRMNRHLPGETEAHAVQKLMVTLETEGWK